MVFKQRRGEKNALLIKRSVKDRTSLDLHVSHWQCSRLVLLYNCLAASYNCVTISDLLTIFDATRVTTKGSPLNIY
jgi:hypothetical protein